jgi:hypothetical protein
VEADDSSRLSKEEKYYKRMPDGKYIPVIPAEPKLMAIPVLSKPSIPNSVISTED